MFTKTITYQPDTHDYDALLNDEYVGSFKTNHDAAVELDRLALGLIANGGSGDPPEIGPDDGTGLGDRDSEGDDPDANPGRAIARHWHRTPRQFIATLRQLDPATWFPLAEAYAEWRGSDAAAVLDIWLLAVQGASVPANTRS